MIEVKMPKMGLTMENGTIVKWRKKEGEHVETGEILLEIMTDKVTMEIESYYSGNLIKILKKEDEEVPVGEIIGYIE